MLTTVTCQKMHLSALETLPDRPIMCPLYHAAPPLISSSRQPQEDIKKELKEYHNKITYVRPVEGADGEAAGPAKRKR